VFFFVSPWEKIFGKGFLRSRIHFPIVLVSAVKETLEEFLKDLRRIKAKTGLQAGF